MGYLKVSQSCSLHSDASPPARLGALSELPLARLVSYFYGLPMGQPCTLAMSSFTLLMPLGMINMKMKGGGPPFTLPE